jgi:prevent-host-death family protein
MRALQIAKDIVSVGELKVQASRLLRQINAGQRPLVITQHGKPAAVMLSPKDYDRLTARLDFIEAVEEGLRDVEAGRWIDDAALDAELDTILPPTDS